MRRRSMLKLGGKDMRSVTRRRLLAGGIAAVLGCTIWFAGASFASFTGPGAPPPARLDPPALGKYFLGQSLVRAEIVVKRAGVLHDFAVRQGRVRSVSADTIAIKEPDRIESVAVSPTAVIRVNGQLATLARIRPGFLVLTISDGPDAPAIA